LRKGASEMYLKVTKEESRLMDIFLPYMTKTLVPKLVEDAPPEAVEAYKKFMEITKGQFDY
jgi:hypothetical protein